MVRLGYIGRKCQKRAFIIKADNMFFSRINKWSVTIALAAAIADLKVKLRIFNVIYHKHRVGGGGHVGARFLRFIIIILS